MSTHCDGRGGRTNQMHRFHPAQFCRIYRIARTLNSDPDRCPGASIRRPSAELLSSMPGRLSLKRSKLQLMGMQFEICMTRIRMGWVRVDIVGGPSIRWPSGCPVDCSSASTGVWLSVSHCAEQITFFTVALWFDFECKPDGCGLVTAPRPWNRCQLLPLCLQLCGNFYLPVAILFAILLRATLHFGAPSQLPSPRPASDLIKFCSVCSVALFTGQPSAQAARKHKNRKINKSWKVENVQQSVGEMVVRRIVKALRSLKGFMNIYILL